MMYNHKMFIITTSLSKFIFNLYIFIDSMQNVLSCHQKIIMMLDSYPISYPNLYFQ